MISEYDVILIMIVFDIMYDITVFGDISGVPRNLELYEIMPLNHL